MNSLFDENLSSYRSDRVGLTSSRSWFAMSIRLNKLLSFISLALAFSLALSSGAFAASTQSATEVRVEAPKRGIPAELVDEGDYYLHPNGSKVKFYRKKDVYALTPRDSRKRSKVKDGMAQIKATFGDAVSQISNHRLGGMTIVRTNNAVRKDPNAPQRSNISIDGDALVAGNAGFAEAEPVLANARGNGDILVTNKLLIKLADSVDVEDSLERLTDRFGLAVMRKVNVSGQVYSVESRAKKNVSQRFSLVRRVANSPLVAWAQPQFSSRPYKTQTQFNPANDALFSQQWHLNNAGFRGSLCDADCDVAEAWGTPAIGPSGVGENAGDGMVIAIIDDGIQLNHPEFAGRYWRNPGEAGNPSDGIDNDLNGFIDDFQGWDFVDDSTTDLLDPSSGQACQEASDGDSSSDPTNRPGQDNIPDGNDFADCVFVEGDDVAQDDHGTAVAGLAAAGANGFGTIGTAFLAQILPIRLISDFDNGVDFCARAAEAMEYAGRYADVVSNSWGLDEGTCTLLEQAITDVIEGDVTSGGVNVSKRSGGSPVIFSSGNSAAGWVKVTAQVSAGEHAYEWRFLRGISDPTTRLDSVTNSAYVDDLIFPGQSVEGFEQGLPNEFTTECSASANNCINGCTNNEPVNFCPVWQVNTDPQFVRNGSQSIQIDFADTSPGSNFDINDFESDGSCAYSYLHSIQDGPAGNVSFFVWVDSDQQADSGQGDRFEFLVDGQERVSFGDFSNFIDNDVAYPANSVPGIIVVGASDSGNLTNLGSQSSGNLSQESRIFYSQFGPELDVLAPSSTQHLGITTTDRFGVTSPGFNLNEDLDGNGTNDPNYTNTFGGTSASAPIVAGVAAAIIADNTSFSALQVEARLKNTADEIGNLPYVAGRNNIHGHGRLNMHRAINNLANGPAVSCSADAFDYSPVPNFPGNDLVLAGFSPVTTDLFGFGSCPAEGPLVVSEGGDFCFPIVAQNSNVAVICL